MALFPEPVALSPDVEIRRDGASDPRDVAHALTLRHRDGKPESSRPCSEAGLADDHNSASVSKGVVGKGLADAERAEVDAAEVGTGPEWLAAIARQNRRLPKRVAWRLEFMRNAGVWIYTDSTISKPNGLQGGLRREWAARDLTRGERRVQPFPHLPSRCPGACWLPLANCGQGRGMPHSFDAGEGEAGEEPEGDWAERRAA